MKSKYKIFPHQWNWKKRQRSGDEELRHSAANSEVISQFLLGPRDKYKDKYKAKYKYKYKDQYKCKDKE